MTCMLGVNCWSDINVNLGKQQRRDIFNWTNTFHAHLFLSELLLVNFVVLKLFETSVLLVRDEVKRALIIQDCVQSDFTPTSPCYIHFLSLLHLHSTWRTAQLSVVQWEPPQSRWYQTSEELLEYASVWGQILQTQQTMVRVWLQLCVISILSRVNSPVAHGNIQIMTGMAKWKASFAGRGHFL